MTDKRTQEKAWVINQTEMIPGIMDLLIKAPKTAASAAPGQFISVYCADNRLIVHLNPLFVDCFLEVRQDVVAPFGIVSKLDVVIRETGFVSITKRVAGEFSPVACFARIHVFEAVVVNAYFDGKVVASIDFLARPHELEDRFLEIVLVREHGEMVCGDAATVLVAERIFEYPRKFPQELIAFREAVLRIEVLHAAQVHVEHDRL